MNYSSRYPANHLEKLLEAPKKYVTIHSAGDGKFIFEANNLTLYFSLESYVYNRCVWRDFRQDYLDGTIGFHTYIYLNHIRGLNPHQLLFTIPNSIKHFRTIAMEELNNLYHTKYVSPIERDINELFI